MDNQQKYLLTGFAAALAIIIFINAFTVFSSDSSFWYMVFAVVVSVMMLLVVNIFVTTKAITLRADDAQNR